MTRKQFIPLLIAVIIASFCGALVSAFFLIGEYAIAQQVKPSYNVIRANKIELVDRLGQTRVRIAATTDGSYLILYDKRGNPRVDIIAESNGAGGAHSAGIDVYHHTGGLAVSLESRDNYAHLSLYNEKSSYAPIFLYSKGKNNQYRVSARLPQDAHIQRPRRNIKPVIVVKRPSRTSKAKKEGDTIEKSMPAQQDIDALWTQIEYIRQTVEEIREALLNE